MDIDINAALARMRQLQRAILPITGTLSDDLTEDDISSLMVNADALVTVTEAIDGWLSKGGFLPDAWKH